MDKQTKIGVIAIAALVLSSVGYNQYTNMTKQSKLSSKVVHFNYNIPSTSLVGVMLDGDDQIVINAARRNEGIDAYIVDSAGNHMVVLFDCDKYTALEDFKLKHPDLNISEQGGQYIIIPKITEAMSWMSEYSTVGRSNGNDVIFADGGN